MPYAHGDTGTRIAWMRICEAVRNDGTAYSQTRLYLAENSRLHRPGHSRGRRRIRGAADQNDRAMLGRAPGRTSINRGFPGRMVSMKDASAGLALRLFQMSTSLNSRSNPRRVNSDTR